MLLRMSIKSYRAESFIVSESVNCVCVHISTVLYVYHHRHIIENPLFLFFFGWSKKKIPLFFFNIRKYKILYIFSDVYILQVLNGNYSLSMCLWPNSSKLPSSNWFVFPIGYGNFWTKNRPLQNNDCMLTPAGQISLIQI